MKPVSPMACKYTHRHIVHGLCPWCERLIVQVGSPVKNSVDAMTKRQWNVESLLHALQSQDETERMMVISNVWFHGFSVTDSLLILRPSLSNSNPRIQHMATNALSSLGRHMLPAEAERFEQEMLADPGDCAFHIILLGYYMSKSHAFESARSSRYSHLLWIIEHSPELALLGGAETEVNPKEAPEVYGAAKELWLGQVRCNEGNLTILDNAARHFARYEPALSETLLLKARTLDPDNPKWSARLGDLYLHMGHRGAGSTPREAAAHALRECLKSRLRAGGRVG